MVGGWRGCQALCARRPRAKKTSCSFCVLYGWEVNFEPFHISSHPSTVPNGCLRPLWLMVHAAAAKATSLAPLLHQDPKPHTNLPPVNDDLPRNLPKKDLRRFSLVQHTRTHVFANDRIGSSPFPLPYLSPEEHLVPRASFHESRARVRAEGQGRCADRSLARISLALSNTGEWRTRERSAQRPRGGSHPDASSGEVPQGIGRPGTSFWSWRFRRGTISASRNLPQDTVTTERLSKATAETRKRGRTTAYVFAPQKRVDFSMRSDS